MVGEYEMTNDDTMHIERAYFNKEALANGKCSIEESRKKITAMLIAAANANFLSGQ